MSKALLIEEPIEVAGQIFSAEEVIERLRPHVTDERFQRFTDVAKSRTYTVAPVLENIYDRGNISAVMRSAEAFGFLNFNIIEQPGAKFKAANRVTQGADKWLDIKKYPSTKECVNSLKNSGYKIYCTHLEAAKPIDEIDFTKPSALVLGNEKDGVTEEIQELSDGNIILPMHGFAQSFNISVAGALCFQKIFEQRKAKLGASGDLSAEQQHALVAHYLLRSLEGSEKYFS